MIPRHNYPLTRAGYHEWRNELKCYHAGKSEEVVAVLIEVVLPSKTPGVVRPYVGQWQLSYVGTPDSALADVHVGLVAPEMTSEA